MFEQQRISTSLTSLSRYRSVLNSALGVFFSDILRVVLTRPLSSLYFLKTLGWQRKAARTRLDWAARGLQVPAILLFSITTKCNLTCKFCYAQTLHPPSDDEMDAGKIRSVIREARELGVSFIVIAGGEPFLREELLDITREFPRIVFIIFSNGLLVDDQRINELRRQRNVIPLLSLEGREESTDERRGTGVHEHVAGLVGKLRRAGIFFGTSLTVTRTTFTALTDPAFIEQLVGRGCKFFLFVEYTPVAEGTDELVITADQRSRLMELMSYYHGKRKALFLTVPGVEENVGGCLAAGRGFVHLTAEGDLEPCPFVPYSDSNVRDMTFRQALESPFLSAIRRHPEKLAVSAGGCCLWKKREWVQSLLGADA